jgi:heme/copper-type cytochrome/quinol oxidase subunit 1
MTRRDKGFLFLGLGAGLIIASAAMIAEFAVWSHHMFILGFNWRPESALLALPFLLVLWGSMLLRNKEGSKAR